MAEKTFSEAFDQQRFNAPIAGQSLTSDPESSAPYERPPEFTEIHPAMEYVWTKIVEPRNYSVIVEQIADGVPIMDLVQGILFVGVRDGIFNTDLMLLLLEPTAYMLIALAERLDLPMEIYDGEEEDDYEEEEILGIDTSSAKMQDLLRSFKSKKVPEGVLTERIEQDLQTLQMPEQVPEEEVEAAPAPAEDPESLMAATPAPAPAPASESLMARPTA